jgi:multicomponent Na+:H+ antiporter subunit D
VTNLVAVPLVVPLLAAALGLLTVRHRRSQRTVSWVSAGTFLVAACGLAAQTLSTGPVGVQVGGFPGGVAIALVADGWASLLLVVTGVVYLAAMVFAWAAGDDRNPAFHPLVQVLLAGIGLAFTTADLFNLFVAFEVMLIASYVLCSLGSGATGRRATFTYITVNLAASTVLLIGAGLVYGVVGSVNLGVLHGAVATTPGATLALTFPLLAFAIKAGLVPVNGWLPIAYTRISPAVAALFSGLLTKVGIYALYRVVTLLFPDRPGLGIALGVVAGATMGVGVLQAVGQGGMRRILSFHITSQVGYMVMGLALGGVAGLAAGIAYTLHHIVVKTALFLTAGAVTLREGTDELARLGGLARRAPTLAAAFGVSAAALAGLPPLSGFIPKLALLQVAFGRGWWVLGGLSLAVSALTLVSMLKIQTGVFWGAAADDDEPLGHAPHGHEEASADPTAAPGTEPGAGLSAEAPQHATTLVAERPTVVTTPKVAHPRVLALPALVLAALAVALGLGAGPLLQVATTAAEQLDDPTGYVEVLLEGAP